jgi:hypothetical protein
MEFTLNKQWRWHNGAHPRTSDGDGTMELALKRMMALEMELCALLLETIYTKLLSPPKMQKGEKERL